MDYYQKSLSQYSSTTLTSATTLQSLFWASVSRSPNSLAVIYDDLDHHRFLTYKQLASLSCLVISAIHANFVNQPVDQVRIIANVPFSL